jgi:hypothetical protein
VFDGRKYYPQITQITQIKFKVERGVKKYDLREFAQSADYLELRSGAHNINFPLISLIAVSQGNDPFLIGVICVICGLL